MKATSDSVQDIVTGQWCESHRPAIRVLPHQYNTEVMAMVSGKEGTENRVRSEGRGSCVYLSFSPADVDSQLGHTSYSRLVYKGSSHGVGNTQVWGQTDMNLDTHYF